MKSLRVLWLDDGRCILFNPSSKRISGICPEIVGRVVEKTSNGADIMGVLLSENVDYRTGLKTILLLDYMKGNGLNSSIQAIGMREKRFRLLALAPTSMCNLRCVYCSGDSGESHNFKMSWELAKASIDFFFMHSMEEEPCTLQFHGAGEPMVNAETVKKSVEYAKSIASRRGQRLYTRITTNGMLSEEMALYLAENFDHVTLSLDGPPDVHNLQRPTKTGKGSYDDVIRTMNILEGKGVLKRINTVVTTDGLSRMEETLRHIRFVSSVKQLRMLPMEYCGRCEKDAVPELGASDFDKEFLTILPIAKELGFEMLSVLEQAEYHTEHYCGACGYNMCVTPDGFVSTCVEAMDVGNEQTKELFIGEYDAGGIHIDWNKVFWLRNRTYAALDGCKECAFRTNCSGSCLIRAARKNGTVMSVDPDACERVKKVLSEHFVGMARSVPEKPKDLTFKELVEVTRKVASQFDEINQRQWTTETILIELAKQVGDLSRCFMANENYYLTSRKGNVNYNASVGGIANELADILHGVIRIADQYGIDLMDAAMRARYDELGYIYENR